TVFWMGRLSIPKWFVSARRGLLVSIQDGWSRQRLQAEGTSLKRNQSPDSSRHDETGPSISVVAASATQLDWTRWATAISRHPRSRSDVRLIATICLWTSVRI